MTLLRLISFCIDAHEAYIFRDSASTKFQKFSSDISEKHKLSCKICLSGKECLRSRQDDHQPLVRYDLIHFYSFLVYPPLYVAGPIITYNGWVSQVYTKQNVYSDKEQLKYVFRTLGNFLVFEIFLHLIYSNSLITNESNSEIWKSLNLLDLSVLCVYELVFLWMKFSCIWRLPRAFALLNGIETPENMNRCVMNNYCFEGFWRSWHRSFNQWLIRYIFVPLGGSQYKMYNIWVVFSFVAIWHDFKVNLLFWGWGICASLMPEMIVKGIVSKKVISYEIHLVSLPV